MLKYNSGIASYYADGQIGFTNSEDADYFIEHWDSKMHDYKDAMPDNRDVSFSVFHKKPDGGLFEDVMIKRVKDSTSWSLE